MVEFALIAPIFLGIVLCGIELANCIIANIKVQRMATMTSDLVAQSGVGEVGVTEAQIYDLFYAMDSSAKPLNMTTNGRVIISAIKGTDATPSNTTDPLTNTITWQRFDGGYIATSRVGCKATTTDATIQNNRKLGLDELMFHVQVSYRYQPLISQSIANALGLQSDITRVAAFRARSLDFQEPTPVSGRPPKEKCNTATGL